MLPNDDVVRSAMIDALTHATTGTLCAKVCVGLIAVPFLPAVDGTLPPTPFPTFTGYAPKERPAVDAQVVLDPVTGRTTIRLPPPVGGWTFVASGDPAEPVTIHGYYVTIGVEDSDPQVPVTGSALFTSPIVISQAGDFITIQDILLEFLAPYMV